MWFPGWQGIATSIAVPIVVAIVTNKATGLGRALEFEKNEGDFEKQLAVYLDIAKFILTLAAGGIVLIISSTALATSAKRLPAQYASPLILLMASIFYGILFMPMLAINYEGYRNESAQYLRHAYVRNQTLGFSSLTCFCLRVCLAHFRSRFWITALGALIIS
jgi:hypothetical protein